MKRYLIPVVTMLSVSALSCNSPKEEVVIPADKAVEAKVEQVLKGMTLEEKAGQLVQLSIMVLQDETNEALDPAKLDKIIGQYKVGSILNVMNDHAHSREHTAQICHD